MPESSSADTASPPLERIALIVAAGRGHRAGHGVPKQFRPLSGKTVLTHTMNSFINNSKIDAVCVVIHQDDGDLYRASADQLPSEKLLAPTTGGQTRQDSVRLGLEYLTQYRPSIVLIHDAARPLVSASTIDDLLSVVSADCAALAASPVVDTLKRDEDGLCAPGAPSREGLWRAATPQAFPFSAILAAHRTITDMACTDDAEIAVAAGLPVRLVPSNPENIKITQAEDFTMAEKLMAAACETRTCQGYDVHRLIKGDGVTLCGIKIPHDHSLEGHSDADVALHALTDALLGCVCAGDIGSHFPPTESQWKGAKSELFLREALRQVTAKNGRINHCDVTLICEAPRIAPHVPAMRAQIAKMLEIDPSRVSVKATTTEKLGFTGRKEGIAAMASATIELPR